MAVTAEVDAAVGEIRQNWPGSEVTVREDGQGGANVIVEHVTLEGPYIQDETWIGFQITFQYPYSDVYPHFVRGDLARADGAGLGEGMSLTQYEGRSAVQVSRRSNHLNPATDTALIKLLKVLDWLRSRP
jgi:hypothetical protein